MSSEKKKTKNKLFLMIVTGPMGAGKTTTAKILHKSFKRTVLLGLDHIKKNISDFKRNTSDNQISNNVLFVMTNEYLKQNINVIIDQAINKKYLEIYKKIARKCKAIFLVFQLEASKELLNHRVVLRSQLPGKYKPSKARIVRNYHLFLKNRHKNAIIFDSEKLTTEQIVNNILKELKQ